MELISPIRDYSNFKNNETYLEYNVQDQAINRFSG
jgi:hypothetical protein